MWIRRCDAINQGINPIPEEAGLEELIKKHGGKRLIASPNYEDAKDCSTFIVIVPLFIDDLCNLDFRILESAFRSLGKILKLGDLAVLETTVPPDTTETLIKGWAGRGVRFEAGPVLFSSFP